MFPDPAKSIAYPSSALRTTKLRFYRPDATQRANRNTSSN
jgi:hypothetical protein